MPHALIVQASPPICPVADWVRERNADPGNLHESSGGNGSGAQLGTQLFKAMAGVEEVHVPYSGAPEIIAPVIVGTGHKKRPA